MDVGEPHGGRDATRGGSDDDAEPTDVGFGNVPGELRVNAVCPACKRAGLTVRTITHDVPHFGEALQTLLRCDHCGYRNVDFLIVDQKEPVRYTFVLRDAEGLQARVIRSNSGTIRIPEVGLVAEPTPLSEAFVSNVEGLVLRMKTALRWAESVAEDPEHLRLAREKMGVLDEALEGGRALTVILEDPLGNSAIVSDDARREVLSEAEAAQLESGVIFIDMEDLESADGASTGGE